MARAGRKHVLNWIKQDYKTNPMRFISECCGMVSNLIASLILMWFSPNPPMFWAYIFFILASILLLGSALSRKSFGFTAMYIVYLGIDGVGFLKTLL
jgi:hypothetical protein